MNTRHKLIYFLAQNTALSKRDAKIALETGRVKLNQQVQFTNELIKPYDSVFLDDICILNGERFVYYKYYKPPGIECTLNKSIPESLSNLLGVAYDHLFYVGRLDKDSEGLLLLTNDGFIYNKIINPTQKINKQYIVQVENEINNDFKIKMESGVNILGTQTLACQVDLLDSNTFVINLTQGLNRQIRRMCFKLGNYVTSLKRLSIGQIKLNQLKPGELMLLDKEEIAWLKNLTKVN